MWCATRDSTWVVWDLGPIFDGDFTGCREVAALVLGTLQDCTERPQTVVCHDWVRSRLGNEAAFVSMDLAVFSVVAEADEATPGP